jgi:hypothetical protein
VNARRHTGRRRSSACARHGLLGDHVLARIIDLACNMKVGREQRQRVCAGLAGDVVEIGTAPG